MKKKKKYILSVLLFLILIVFTYYFILKDYSINEFINSIKSCNKMYILFSFLAMGVYTLLGCLYNKRFLYHFKKGVNLYKSLGYVFTEAYFSGITPSAVGGQPVEMVEMKKDGISYEMNSIIVLINSLLYKLAIVIIATIGILFFSKEVFALDKLFIGLLIFGYITSVLFILGLALLIYSKRIIPALLKFLIKIGTKLKIIKNKEKLENKLEKAIKGYKECAQFTKKNPQVLVESFIILLLQKLSQLSVSYFIYKAFGGNTYSFIVIVGLQACINLAADFIPTPGSVAISENLILKINNYIYGAESATSAMMLFRGITFYIYVLVAGIFYLIFHFVKRKPAIDLE